MVFGLFNRRRMTKAVAALFLLAGIVTIFYASVTKSSTQENNEDEFHDHDAHNKPSKSDKKIDDGKDTRSQNDAGDKSMVTAATIDDLTDTIREMSSMIRNLQSEVQTLKQELKRKEKVFPTVKFRNYKERKRILVTGGTGFVGSHLVDRLMQNGHEVIVLDNHYTGRKRNVEHWIGHSNFELVHHDIVNPFFVEVDEIYHLASPASPPHYMFNPVKTIKTNAVGTMNILGLARRTKATVLLASTSEVYGDPEVHPQPETYWGHVNPVGPRACYDEGKRVAEALMMAYHKQEKVKIRIARIFNTFGPRMHMNDGRVVSNFILQALQNEPITVYGEGDQTRSFQYVSDLVDGLIALMESNVTVPVNLGNPEEHTIKQFALIIKNLTSSSSDIKYVSKPVDDPQQRRPDITRAWDLLKWKPQVPMVEGLQHTIKYFRKELKDNRLTGHTYNTAHPLEYFEQAGLHQQHQD